MRLLSLVFLLSFSLLSYADPITGIWRTIDEEGESKSIVKIYQEGDEYFGKIIQLLQEPEDTVCSKCKGDDKDKRLIGLVIIKNLTEKDGKYVGGTVLDPTKGKTYRTRLWAEGDTLQVRGYLGMFFRTQAWYRYTAEEA